MKVHHLQPRGMIERRIGASICIINRSLLHRARHDHHGLTPSAHHHHRYIDEGGHSCRVSFIDEQPIRAIRVGNGEVKHFNAVSDLHSSKHCWSRGFFALRARDKTHEHGSSGTSQRVITPKRLFSLNRLIAPQASASERTPVTSK